MRERTVRQKSNYKNMKQHLEVINECSNSEIKSINSSAIKNGMNFAHREKPSGLKVKLKDLNTSVEDEINLVNDSIDLAEPKLNEVIKEVDSEDKRQKLYDRVLKKAVVEKNQIVDTIRTNIKQRLEKQEIHFKIQPKDSKQLKSSSNRDHKNPNSRTHMKNDNKQQELDDVETNSINQVIVTDYKSRKDDMEYSCSSEGSGVNNVNHKDKAAALSHMRYNNELKKTSEIDEEINGSEAAASLKKAHADTKILKRESPEEMKSDVNVLHETKEFDTNKFTKGMKRSRNHYKTQEEIGNDKLSLVNLALNSNNEPAVNKMVRNTSLTNEDTKTPGKFSTSPKKRLDVSNGNNAEEANKLIEKVIHSLDQHENSENETKGKKASNPFAITRSNDKGIIVGRNSKTVKNKSTTPKDVTVKRRKQNRKITEEIKNPLQGNIQSTEIKPYREAIVPNKIEAESKIKHSISAKKLRQINNVVKESNNQQAKRLILKTGDVDTKAAVKSSSQKQNNGETDNGMKVDQKPDDITRQASKRLSVSSGNLAFSRINNVLGKGKRISNFESFNKAVQDFYKAPQPASEDTAPKSVAEALRIAQGKDPKRFQSVRQIIYPSNFLFIPIETPEDIIGKELLTASNEHTAIYTGTLWRYMPGFAVHFQPRFCLLTNSAFLYFESKSKALSPNSRPLASISVSSIESARRVKVAIPEAKQIVKRRKRMSETLALPQHQFEIFLKEGKSELESSETGKEQKHVSVCSSSKHSGSYLSQINQQVTYTHNQ
eukprot:TRINITY_DN11339_c0_g1_i3.p1 TRINITY_DN11339_c0_g1~~TRINITY_DN11339_c0_g1_i3.p1  ORF type:complete len:773 (-),score=104.03 TRINITY_DN11339_c0_g1_i3:338-2656(-)